MLKPNYPLLQSLWVWQHFMDIFDEKKIAWKSHSKPKHYEEQALKYSDVMAKQGGKE